jgi:hypothetical protein
MLRFLAVSSLARDPISHEAEYNVDDKESAGWKVTQCLIFRN